MKRLLILLSAVAIAGAGCFGGSEPAATFEGTAYENETFGFAFDYPSNMEVRNRPEEQWDYSYVGKDTKLFASLRDTVITENVDTIAYFLAAPDLSVDDFVAGLEASDEAINVTSREELKVNDLEYTKLVNTTAFGQDKAHYLFELEGQTIIVSIFLFQDEPFEPLLGTFRLF